MTPRTCEHCEHWHKVQTMEIQKDGSSTGTCRRYPPVPVMVGVEQTPVGNRPKVVPMWSSMAAGEGCGEWARREKRRGVSTP